MSNKSNLSTPFSPPPWNKGRLLGQKPPLKPKEAWAIRIRLQIVGPGRDLALFNLAIDSKLRGCDLVALKVDDICLGGRVRERAMIVQRKRAGRFNSRSQRIRGQPFRRGWKAGGCVPAILSFRPAAMVGHTFPLDSTLALSGSGYRALGSTPTPTEHIRFVERRRHRYIERPATSEPFSCCLATLNWRALFDT